MTSTMYLVLSLAEATRIELAYPDQEIIRLEGDSNLPIVATPPQRKRATRAAMAKQDYWNAALFLHTLLPSLLAAVNKHQ